MSNSGKTRASGSPAIVWFRDDLRTTDNPALTAACEGGRPVVAVFVHDTLSPDLRPLGAAQRWMLHHALAALDSRLQALGGRLLLRTGPAREAIRALVAETRATAVYWNRRHVPGGIAIDTELKRELSQTGVEVRSFAANLLHEPSRLLTGAGGPFRVYSPFWRVFERQEEPPRKPLPSPAAIEIPADFPRGVALEDLALLPTKPDWAHGLRETWTAGEEAALDRLRAFVGAGLAGYADGRDLPGENHVSRLSPYLRFGMISPYQAWHAVSTADAPQRDREKFLKELGWREFAWHLLFHYPDLATRNFDDRFDDFPWQGTAERIEAWRRGMTGYPIVDAGMRQLWQTGYMHNRVRMITASFLVKHLMVDWRVGEEWFWDTLVDADPANNPASWQWVAGCGADAAPYFRVFNPILQGEKFDADGAYVRRWVPELRRLPDRLLHKPWEADRAALAAAGVELGRTYPRPIVDHGAARQGALQAFETLKKAS